MESTYFKPSRYLALVIHSQDPVKVVQVGSRQLQYPNAGAYQSVEAPWILRYFNATDKTIKACTSDAYTDNYRSDGNTPKPAITEPWATIGFLRHCIAKTLLDTNGPRTRGQWHHACRL